MFKTIQRIRLIRLGSSVAIPMTLPDPDPCYDPESRSVHAACLGPEPAPQPKPSPAALTCTFLAFQYTGPETLTTAGSGGFKGQQIAGVFEQTLISFLATGGDGNYSWTNTQTGTAGGTINGKPIAGRVGPETLSNIGAGPLAIFEDNPGLPFFGTQGTAINSASVNWNFSLTATVTSGGVTVQCPTVTWSAWVNFDPNDGFIITSGGSSFGKVIYP